MLFHFWAIIEIAAICSPTSLCVDEHFLFKALS